MVDESRILRVPSPVQPKAFRGVAKAGCVRMYGSNLGVRPPERGEFSPAHAARVEAARQWLTRQPELQAHQVAELLCELFHRQTALKELVEQKMPEGELKAMILQVIEGKLIAVKQ